MYIKLDENGKLIETCSERQQGFLEKDFDIDMSRFLYAEYAGGKIVYNDKNAKKHAENRTIMQNMLIEEAQINEWLAKYDSICQEHMRCERLGIKCDHNISDWDEKAIVKIQRLKELKEQIER